MLLTSSQVSLALSTTIVVTFTVLLFLSGYLLQRQSVAELQSVMRPRIPRLVAQSQKQPGSRMDAGILMRGGGEEREKQVVHPGSLAALQHPDEFIVRPAEEESYEERGSPGKGVGSARHRGAIR